MKSINKKIMEHNEKREWDNLNSENKSYTTNVLHCFTYRPKWIRKSWIKEEVITWELIRALEILPRIYFLKNLLVLINKKNPSCSNICNNLINDLDKIKIEPYPRRGEKGIEYKQKSDIELSFGDNCLWIEAKVGLWNKEDIVREIRGEKDSPNLNKYQNNEIIALLPESQDYDGLRISWREISKSFEKANKTLESDFKDISIIPGYLKISRELIGRINTFKINI